MNKIYYDFYYKTSLEQEVNIYINTEIQNIMHIPGGLFCLIANNAVRAAAASASAPVLNMSTQKYDIFLSILL